jgi:dihydroorotase
MGSNVTIFQNARIIDPETEFDQYSSVCVRDGIISEISENISAYSDNIVIDCQGHTLIPGLIDMKVSVGDPLYGDQETLESIGKAAVASGITSLLIQPDCSPVLDEPTFLKFALDHAEKISPARIFMAGALTQQLEGKHLSEIGLLQQAGALCFSQGDYSIHDSSVFIKALNYARGFDALVLLQSTDSTLNTGVMNQGDLSTRLGLSGISSLSELLGLERDLKIVQSTHSKAHIHMLSCSESIEIINRYRKNGVKITTGVSALHLMLNENDLIPYRTFCKVMPPLRKEEDRLSLVEGVIQGTIDIIVSNHQARMTEQKRLPFGEASFGSAGIETLLPIVLNLWHRGDCSLAHALKPVTCNPSKILGLDRIGKIQVGYSADLTLIDLNASRSIIRSELKAQATNTPLEGYQFEGIVQKTWINGVEVYNHECV